MTKWKPRNWMLNSPSESHQQKAIYPFCTLCLLNSPVGMCLAALPWYRLNLYTWLAGL